MLARLTRRFAGLCVGVTSVYCSCRDPLWGQSPRKRGIALTAYFCGCEPCHEAGRLWGRIQRGGELDSVGKGFLTVVFQGDSEAAKTFVAQVGLEPARTKVVADPQSEMARKNKALPCPRMFVKDSKGKVRYTNNRPDDAAQTGSPSLMVARAVDALRALAKDKAPPRKKKH